jgi:class 3 adenylate cyclase
MSGELSQTSIPRQLFCVCVFRAQSLLHLLTVLVTNINGFTAWCSVREPSQVFILLETLYNTYDLIAQKRKVFKVETIGDKLCHVYWWPPAQCC